MQIFGFFDFFQNFLFPSKKLSFPSRISKNELLCLDFPKKHISEKERFFDKNHGLTPSKIFDFLDFLQTSQLRSKKHFFPSRISNNDLLWLDFPKKHIWEKGRLFEKTLGLTALQILDFLEFFKLYYSVLKTILFYSEYQKTIFCG